MTESAPAGDTQLDLEIYAEARQLRRDYAAQVKTTERLTDEAVRYRDRAEAAEAKLAAVRELHQPRRDAPLSLVDWSYCSCGAMESFIAADGIPSLGPARYPCKTVRILDGSGT